MNSPSDSPLRLMAPTRLLVLWMTVAILLILIGWNKTINLLLLIGYFLIATAIINYWVARRVVARTSARLRPIAPVFAGRPFEITVDVENQGTSPTTVEVFDTGTSPRTAWFVSELPAEETIALHGERTLPARGRHTTAGVRIESDYPVGLVRWSRDSEPGDDLIVLPRIGELDLGALRHWLSRAGGGDADRHRPSRRASPSTGDVRGVRPYRSGDSLREIHWRSTARRNQLIVREYDRSDSPNLMLIIDPTESRREKDKPALDFERALELAATIVRVWSSDEDGGDVDLVIPGLPLRRIPARASHVVVRQALVPLCDLAPMLEVPSISGEALHRSRNQHRLIVSTLSPNCPVLAQFHRQGLSAAVVVPVDAPTWYLPPPG